MTAFLLEIIFQLSGSTLLSFLTLILSALSLIVLVVYTIYTHSLKKSAERQTNELILQRNLSLTPSIATHLRYSNNGLKSELLLENIGNGVAYNLSLEITILDTRNFLMEEIDLSGYLIQPTEKKRIAIEFSYNDRSLPSIEVEKLFEELIKNGNLNISMCYKDITGNRYHQENKLQKGVYLHGPANL